MLPLVPRESLQVKIVSRTLFVSLRRMLVLVVSVLALQKNPGDLALKSGKLLVKPWVGHPHVLCMRFSIAKGQENELLNCVFRVFVWHKVDNAFETMIGNVDV